MQGLAAHQASASGSAAGGRRRQPVLAASTAGRAQPCGRRSRARATQQRSRRLAVSVRAGPVEINEEDLMQAPDRAKWYESKFCADSMPDWNIAEFVRSEQVSPDLRAVTVRCEISRERVPLRNAYKHVGQRASLRVNQGLEYQVTIASPPFPDTLNKTALFNVRGDLFANETKSVKIPTTVMGEVTVLVSKKEAPEVFALSADDALEVGPFVGSGVNLRGSPLMAIYRYPTIVIFTAGKGIAAVKALLESSADVASLNTPFRKDVRVYYKAPNEASLCFKEAVAGWEEGGVQVYTTTRSFQDAFDDDDSLTYDPDYTGALVFTGGDEEAEKEALQVCKEAEITEVLTDSIEQPEVIHLSSIPNSFSKFKIT